MRRLKEIWKETIKKHLEKWRRLPGMATLNLNGYANNRLYFYTIKETERKSIINYFQYTYYLQYYLQYNL